MHCVALMLQTHNVALMLQNTTHTNCSIVHELCGINATQCHAHTQIAVLCMHCVALMLHTHIAVLCMRCVALMLHNATHTHILQYCACIVWHSCHALLICHVCHPRISFVVLLLFHTYIVTHCCNLLTDMRRQMCVDRCVSTDVRRQMCVDRYARQICATDVCRQMRSTDALDRSSRQSLASERAA